MELTFLGGGREVGRAGIQVDTGGGCFLMDYGINVERFDTPLRPTKPLDGVLLSHTHLDHGGLIPLLYKEGFQKPSVMTAATHDLLDLLLYDSIKVQKKKGLEPFFSGKDIERMKNFVIKAEFERPLELGGCQITFHDAGHVPGSASIVVDSGSKRVLYTGDIKLEETNLMKPAYSGFKDIDAVVMESTYSYKNHPPREELSEKLKQHAKETLLNGGLVLLPSFAVGRTQEILLALQGVGFPVHVDGMGREATEIVLRHPKSVNNAGMLRKAFARSNKVFETRDRKRLIRRPGVVIATAGMLQAGSIVWYIKKLWKRSDVSMVLTGFQVPGTPGRGLLESGRYIHEDVDVEPKFPISFFDFSAHAGRDNLIRLIEKTSPQKVFLVHGDRTPAFAEELKGLGFDCTAPKNGESFKI